jgi:hypothetical protein
MLAASERITAFVVRGSTRAFGFLYKKGLPVQPGTSRALEITAGRADKDGCRPIAELSPTRHSPAFPENLPGV